MRTNALIDNPFRIAVECYVGLAGLFVALIIYQHPRLFELTTPATFYGVQIMVILFSLHRLWQGFGVFRFQQRLLQLKAFSMTTHQVPLILGTQYVGRGFAWRARHTHRNVQLQAVTHEAYQKKSWGYQWARRYEKTHNNRLSHWLGKSFAFNPWRPLPDSGGKSWLHGLGKKERDVGIPESLRARHTLVLGTTGVGKTRLFSILANQDIRRGKAVIVLDPKGDLDILRDLYAACAVSHRLNDFKIVHVAFPTLSAKLNTLSSYSDVSEVATRITSAMNASGEGAQFRDFAWKYINITVNCLVALGEPINYRTIGFYITRPDVLLVQYADRVLPQTDPTYTSAVQSIIDDAQAQQFEKGDGLSTVSRTKAVQTYLKSWIETRLANDETDGLVNDILVPLYDAAALDSTYYQKITASVGPVLDKINQSQASPIFSFANTVTQPIVNLMDAIVREQVLYIGLNSLSNRQVSEAIGKAIISDLVSCAGRLYNAGDTANVALYCDEFSEIVQEEFITLLNKAGSAGFQITAACQTIQDLGAAFSGNPDKAKMLEGNFQTQVFLRVKNKETAEVLTQQLNEVDVITASQGSTTADVSAPEQGIFFNTSNDVRTSAKALPLLHPNDVISLPKGQAFLFTNGGELSKVRLPLPQNDSLAPRDFVELIETVNQTEGQST